MPVPPILQGRRGPIRLSGDRPRMGGQAEVHRASLADGRIVAVKIALLGETAAYGLRAEREALAGIQRRHPGCGRWLVQLLDVGELPDGRPFLVIPWYDHSMSSWLRVAHPGLRQRLEALVLTAEAVVQLHRSAASLAGVVLHRDLKPGNVLVSDRPEGLRVVLADLGGAKERDLQQSTRNTGIHTPWYAPLEQMLPLEQPPDPSVDVHALAVVIYQALANRPPQVVMSRTGLLTPAAEALMHLHEFGGGSTEADQARYRAMRRAPLSTFVELDQGQALPDEDVNRLREALGQLLEGQVARPGELAAELTALLAPALRDALELDPKRRLNRPEVLLGVLQVALEAVPAQAMIAREAVVAAPVPPVVAVDRSPPEPTPSEGARSDRVRPPPAQDRRSRVVPLLLPGCLLAIGALGVLGLTLIGMRFWGVEAAKPAPEPTNVVVERPATRTPEPATGGQTAGGGQVASHATQTASKLGAGSQGQQDRPRDASLATPPADPGTGGSPGSGSEGTDVGSSKREGAERPPQPDRPPIAIISLDASLGTSPYVTVDGVSRSEARPFKGEIPAGSHDVVIATTRGGAERRFTLEVAAADASHWKLRIIGDLGGVGEKLITVPDQGAPAPVLVQWCRDGAVKFTCPPSSDP